MSEPLTTIIVGAGHRGVLYASYATAHPEELRVVGVADPDPVRREAVRQRFGIAPGNCLGSAAELAARGRIADTVINGTMDADHVPTTLPLLEAGYDVLLEKPICPTQAELLQLLQTARRTGRKVCVGHVLRHAPFYAEIRRRVAAGEIGELITVNTTERVSYHHMAVVFVRGKWNQKATSNPMLMSKCCHDLDLIAWMKSGVRPQRVASLGSNVQFRPERAPAGAGARCLVDCPIEASCLYSARKHYLDHPTRWAFYVWQPLEHLASPTMDDMIASLQGDNPYGRCVWKCDNDVVDHQSVVIEFADGCTATLNMVGGSSRPSRSLHLIGVRGEIQGVLEDSRFVIRHIDPRPGREYTEELVDLTVRGDMTGEFGGHAGGDMRLVADFLRELRGEPRSISSTRLEDSVSGHLLGFCADRAMEERRMVELVYRA